MDGIKIRSATIIGKEHLASKRNCQDGLCILEDDQWIITLVTDGCGDTQSCPHSEVGALLGARLVAQAIRHWLANGIPETDEELERILERVRYQVLFTVRKLALGISDNLREALISYFLFTIIGALITPRQAFFFGVGDGIYIVNGEITEIGPFPNNMPPYLSYELLDSSLKIHHPELLRFTIHRTLPTDNLQSFLVGCDGVKDLINACENNLILPGANEVAGPISQFWENEYLLRTHSGIQKRLNLFNREVVRQNLQTGEIERFHGLLPDDTTFIVGWKGKPREDQ